MKKCVDIFCYLKTETVLLMKRILSCSLMIRMSFLEIQPDRVILAWSNILRMIRKQWDLHIFAIRVLWKNGDVLLSFWGLSIYFFPFFSNQLFRRRSTNRIRESCLKTKSAFLLFSWYCSKAWKFAIRAENDFILELIE